MFIFRRLRINHDTQEFILDSGTVANRREEPEVRNQGRGKPEERDPEREKIKEGPEERDTR
jgi:hypothetical protein